jgi:hypothetical protein
MQQLLISSTAKPASESYRHERILAWRRRFCHILGLPEDLNVSALSLEFKTGDGTILETITLRNRRSIFDELLAVL